MSLLFPLVPAWLSATFLQVEIFSTCADQSLPQFTPPMANFPLEFFPLTLCVIAPCLKFALCIVWTHLQRGRQGGRLVIKEHLTFSSTNCSAVVYYYSTIHYVFCVLFHLSIQYLLSVKEVITNLSHPSSSSSNLVDSPLRIIWTKFTPRTY